MESLIRGAPIKQRQDVIHGDGPFADFRSGDVIRVIYHDAPTALMIITRIKAHSLEGLDGESKCKVTIVSPTELRFYGEIGPNRQTVLRDVALHLVRRG